MTENKNKLIIKILKSIVISLNNVIAVLEDKDVELPEEFNNNSVVLAQDAEKIIEGVFDGKKMIAEDGQVYQVPPNYASKSKLIEGDVLKLTITSQGSFVFKQIGPVEREQIVAELVQDGDEYYAVKEDKKWKLNDASVKFFHGESGDKVTIIIPEGSPSKWAAVENIIKN